MITKMEINGIHMDVDTKLHKYVTKKIGGLDKYFPRHARLSAHVEIKLKESKAKQKQFTCEVILHLPHSTITVSETTMNIFASVDIVETKLKNQIKKYKELHARKRIGRTLLAKLQSR